MNLDRQGTRVLGPKTFRFVEEIWNEFVDIFNQRQLQRQYDMEDMEGEDRNSDLDEEVNESENEEDDSFATRPGL